MAAICRSWLVIQSVNRVIAFSVPWGLAIRNANGDEHQRPVDSHETSTATTAIAAGALLATR